MRIAYCSSISGTRNQRKIRKKARVPTVPKVIDFPRYNMKCSGENVILREIVHVVPGFPLQYISCYIAEIWIAFLTVPISAHKKFLVFKLYFYILFKLYCLRELPFFLHIN